MPLSLPKTPVLGWSSFAGTRAPGAPGALDLPHRALVTSGRAALYHALLRLALPAGSSVLVPSYHCPTLVAPVVHAGLTPVFYGIGEDALPLPDAIERAAAAQPQAMIIAHLFGVPKSLATWRARCDAHRIVLIEDCAHALFGQAGERPVGAWGDYATASLTKFLPVAELGLLASAAHRVEDVALAASAPRMQAKALIDVLEKAARCGRPAGIAAPLRALFALKNTAGAPRTAPSAPNTEAAPDRARELLAASDMARVGQRPTWTSASLLHALPLGRIVERRRAHYDLLAAELLGLAGTRLLVPRRSADTVPYALPLWVDDAERVYAQLRARSWPVFRWDRVWPGAEGIAGDRGTAWSRHVLQLLCHQDLSSDAVRRMARAVREAVAG